MCRSIHLFIIAILITVFCRAQESSLTALEVMVRTDQQSIAEDEYIKISMSLINKKGSTRSRQLEQFIMTDDNDNRSSLIKFLSPADIKGTGFLAIENSERDDDQWLYLPAFNKTRRISPANESDYFVGTDFAFEDLNREDLDDFDYSFLPDTTVNGFACFHILALPVSEKIKESGYSKRYLFIRKDDFVLAGATFFNKKGEKLKVYSAGNIQEIDGKWRAYRMEMHNLKNGHKTILVFDELRLNQGIDKEIFTERYLKR